MGRRLSRQGMGHIRRDINSLIIWDAASCNLQLLPGMQFRGQNWSSGDVKLSAVVMHHGHGYGAWSTCAYHIADNMPDISLNMWT